MCKTFLFIYKLDTWIHFLVRKPFPDLELSVSGNKRTSNQLLIQTRTVRKCWCVGYYRIDKNNTRTIPAPRSRNRTDVSGFYPSSQNMKKISSFSYYNKVRYNSTSQHSTCAILSIAEMLLSRLRRWIYGTGNRASFSLFGLPILTWYQAKHCYKRVWHCRDIFLHLPYLLCCHSDLLLCFLIQHLFKYLKRIWLSMACYCCITCIRAWKLEIINSMPTTMIFNRCNWATCAIF